jgi:hypothetical protein
VKETFENAVQNAPYDEGRRPIFRAMKAEADGLPKVGRSGRELGVRIDGPRRDITVGEDGTVEPGKGGMSVALDAALNLPKPRLPKLLGGEGRDPVFSMVRGNIPLTLHLRQDRYPHALVEPGRQCPLPVFESDLTSTRSLWSKAHD